MGESAKIIQQHSHAANLDREGSKESVIETHIMKNGNPVIVCPSECYYAVAPQGSSTTSPQVKEKVISLEKALKRLK